MDREHHSVWIISIGTYITSLDHARIPIVYDLTKDCHYSYFIEEYLEGDTLYGLVHYLHSAGQTPILYIH